MGFSVQVIYWEKTHRKILCESEGSRIAKKSKLAKRWLQIKSSLSLIPAADQKHKLYHSLLCLQTRGLGLHIRACQSLNTGHAQGEACTSQVTWESWVQLLMSSPLEETARTGEFQSQNTIPGAWAGPQEPLQRPRVSSTAYIAPRS